MKSVFFASAACIAISQDDEPIREMFHNWKNAHAKVYNGNEEQSFQVFSESAGFVALTNAADLPYKLELNFFADIVGTSQMQWFTGGRKDANPLRGFPQVNRTLDHTNVASSVDWVTRGAVTSVKSQGSCGSCWTFGTMAALEGGWKILTGQLLNFAEQQILDCNDNNAGNCKNGGSPGKAFKFLEHTDVCTTDSYSYKARVGSCRSSGCNVGIPAGSIQGIHWFNSENDLKAALNFQPVVVGMDSSPSEVGLYKSGVLTGSCTFSEQDHFVTAVGYGTENGNEYWKIKNSWSRNWGENGYIRIKTGAGRCGVGQDLSYPILSREPCLESPRGWVNKDGEGCSEYVERNYCTSSGGEGSGWKQSSWGPINDYASPSGVGALDACCGCGGGRKGPSPSPSPRPSPPPPPPSHSCSDYSGWTNQDGDTCSTYDHNNYCTSDGKRGSGWKQSSWGSIKNYYDSNGNTAMDACCACGGGHESQVLV